MSLDSYSFLLGMCAGVAALAVVVLFSAIYLEHFTEMGYGEDPTMDAQGTDPATGTGTEPSPPFTDSEDLGANPLSRSADAL